MLAFAESGAALSFCSAKRSKQNPSPLTIISIAYSDPQPWEIGLPANKRRDPAPLMRTLTLEEHESGKEISLDCISATQVIELAPCNSTRSNIDRSVELNKSSDCVSNMLLIETHSILLTQYVFCAVTIPRDEHLLLVFDVHDMGFMHLRPRYHLLNVFQIESMEAAFSFHRTRIKTTIERSRKRHSFHSL